MFTELEGKASKMTRKERAAAMLIAQDVYHYATGICGYSMSVYEGQINTPGDRFTCAKDLHGRMRDFNNAVAVSVFAVGENVDVKIYANKKKVVKKWCVAVIAEVTEAARLLNGDAFTGELNDCRDCGKPKASRDRSTEEFSAADNGRCLDCHRAMKECLTPKPTEAPVTLTEAPRDPLPAATRDLFSNLHKIALTHLDERQHALLVVVLNDAIKAVDVGANPTKRDRVKKELIALRTLFEIGISPADEEQAGIDLPRMTTTERL